MWLLIKGGFCGWQIQRRHCWLQGSKGRCHGNQILAKIGKNLKNSYNLSCVRHIHPQFGFKIGFQLLANWYVTLPYKGQKGRYHGNQFWDKNCYKCISTKNNENVVTRNREFSWMANPNKTFLINKGLTYVAMATKFWAKIGKKNLTEIAITSLTCVIYTHSLVLT